MSILNILLSLFAILSIWSLPRGDRESNSRAECLENAGLAMTEACKAYYENVQNNNF